MIKSILTQTKIMLNKKGFMFGFSAMMMICLLEVFSVHTVLPPYEWKETAFPGTTHRRS